MSDLEKRFHETWLGMVQPVEGLVVSVPVLVEAQCMARQTPDVQHRLVELAPPTRNESTGPAGFTIRDLDRFLDELLQLSPELFDQNDALPDELSLYVPEGRQTIRPTHGLRQLDAATPSDDAPDAEATPASRAGARYVALFWDLADPNIAGEEGIGLDLDKPESKTGPWEYPPTAKLDRLLRHCRVPIGLLTNREVVRLVYAPHGESSGHLTFRLDDMASVGGRPILDAFVMLLSATRSFGVAEDKALPALLKQSRLRQANVTNDLADQVFDALQILLRGFEAAAERDGRSILDDALARDGDHLYKGLLTVLLRLVFLLYAEDRGLLPLEHRHYAEHLSLLGLFERLQHDHGAHPDSMSRRFGAWAHLVALFRTLYLGVEHGDLRLPPRRGALFDPNTYPFLEGWGPEGAAPIVIPEHRAAVRVPSVDDETVFRVLEKLLLFQGQRLSYRTLDVEQIGSVYEALMGFHVVRTTAPAVCLRPSGLWLTPEEALEVPASRRAKWLKETVGLSKAQAEKLAELLKDAKTDEQKLEALASFSVIKKHDPSLVRARAGQLVLQPGTERRRTSSHYTPRSLSAPIVRRTLEPLLAAMGDTPRSDLLLDLKICDPAMGSGAFLVEACRYLADQVVAAWTREGRLEDVARVAPNEDPVLHARRLVAQRCLYGVDRNESAVELAKLSLWLVTLAKDLPFTFVDHALRHGDSLVGLSFDQIRRGHWRTDDGKGGDKSKQLSFTERALQEALDEAIQIRQHILDLATDASPEAQREKERLVADAADASDRARLIADVIVGAFFAETKDKAREQERTRRLALVERWLAGEEGVEPELRALQHDIRARLPVFHWMLEYPEVFYAERPDPLEGGKVNRAAFMDAFVGNPPFFGGRNLSAEAGDDYNAWLQATHPGAGGGADLSAHFFRRAATLLGAHGTIGLIATNTIAQGDTRGTGLQFLSSRDDLSRDEGEAFAPLRLGMSRPESGGARGETGQISEVSRKDAKAQRVTGLLGVRETGEGAFIIYDATSSMMWPGEAAVSVSVVHLACGRPVRFVGEPRLDGARARRINSRLRVGAERDDPSRLLANAGQSFQGSIILGLGFTLTPEERDALVEKDPRNAERIFPYLGGQEVNTSPSQTFDRWVIDFGQMILDEAQAWPDLLARLRSEVMPERRRKSKEIAAWPWWRFWRDRADLYSSLASQHRCLVTARVSKYLMFCCQPTNRVFSDQLYVFQLPTHTAFAVLQSRVHEPWARLLSSSLEDRLRYAASDCFETFPFPEPDPRAVVPALEDVGARLYDTRAAYMIETQQGLTQTYNRLKDPDCHDPEIVILRRLHEEMDRAVLDAYGWTDLEVPPYCPTTPAEHQALERFKDEVIDRLFVLNAKRAAEEAKSTPKKPAKGAKKPAKGKKASPQASLDLDEEG